MITKPGTYVKAILGALGALVSGLIAGLTDGHLTAVEVLVAVGAMLAFGKAVFEFPNSKVSQTEETP